MTSGFTNTGFVNILDLSSTSQYVAFLLLHALHKIYYNDKVHGLLQCLLFML